MNKLLSLLLIFSIITPSFAENSHLDKDQKAPYEGIIFDIPEAQKLRRELIEGNNYRLLNDSYKLSISEYNDILKMEREKQVILITQNDKLAIELKDARNTSDWSKALWFGLGILLTVGAGFAVSRAGR